MGYAWEILSRSEFENLFSMKVGKTSPLSDHWLTTGEIWTLIGMTRYGYEPKRLREARKNLGRMLESQRLRVAL